MNKLTASKLLKFVENNANKIYELPVTRRGGMMHLGETCVLQPRNLPEDIIKGMSAPEHHMYSTKSPDFTEWYDVGRALRWAKRFIKIMTE